MTASNENFDPRSLPNLSNLLTHSAHKRNNKRIANKGPWTSPGLKESFLHNVTIHSTLESGEELPVPMFPSSQSIVVSQDKVTEETRLPISPPPEEEIRIKELITHGITPKELNSRLPVRSRPGVFKVPGPPQSFADFRRQQAHHPASGRSGQESEPTSSGPASVSTASKPNPRKRTRSVFPSNRDSKSIPTDPTSSGQSFSIISSPNPRARKQPKKHDAGVYTGSGFKRRHKRGTSAESLDSADDGHIISRVNLKSPARKKRHDPGIVDYTPEHERTVASTIRRSPTRRKLRARRSSTPDVRYEPPTEQFTPPRDVVLKIPSSTLSSRSQNTKPSISTVVKASIGRKVVKVKAERLTSPFPLPPLDLSKPVPPPSPTDDPLLLVGPPEIVRRSATSAVVPNKILVDASVGADEDIFQDEPNSPGEDEGEFTGRFKFYSVPVKQDPPSSATRARRESWGRPISPFPFLKRLSRPPSPEGIQDRQVLLDEDSPPPSPSVGRKRSVLPTQELEAAPSALKTQAGVSRGFTLSEMEARLESRIAEEKAVVPLPQADHEDVPLDMQNWEGSLSDEDEDVVSVEREITPVDDRESSTPDDTGQALLPGFFKPGNLVKTLGDIAHQQVYVETSHSGQQEYLVDEGAENVNHQNYVQVKTSYVHTPSSRPLSPAFSVPEPLVFPPPSFQTSRSTTDHFLALCDESDNNAPELEGVHDDGYGFYAENVPLSGVVEVSSDDPKAAARAAAILKLHHSYIVDGDVAQRALHPSSSGFLRRSSFPLVDRNKDGDHDEGFIRRVRRKSTAASVGVTQDRPWLMTSSSLIRSTLITPGSPSLPAISPEDALREAETEIRAASASPGRPRTPLRSISLATESLGHCVGTPPSFGMNYHRQPDEAPDPTGSVKEWTKAHWKTLDMCFTDERLAVGAVMGLNNRPAEVDDIEIESVVKRFLAQVGEDEDWDREMLLRRASALSGRQRAGKGAPPSPGPLLSRNTTPEFIVPALTPPATSRPLSPVTEAGVPTKLPPSLLAPRYAHLHEEVITAPSTPPEIPTLASRSSTSATDTPVSQTRPTESRKSSRVSTPHPSGSTVQPCSGVSGRPSAANRVLNYVGSIMGRSGTIGPSKPPLKPEFNALPLPPLEMRQVTRGPINTPAKKAIPKSQPPRELVHLTEIQLPAKQSQFPKAKSAKEMVHLNHVEPPRTIQRPRTVSGPIIITGRTRKDSGGSVKDLVKSFEAVQKNTEDEIKRSNSRLAVRKVASVGKFSAKPLWKP